MNRTTKMLMAAAFISLPIVANAQTVNSLGKVITLRSQTAEDENTLDEPRRICPQTSVYRKFSKLFNYKFEPISLTILRVKAMTNK